MSERRSGLSGLTWPEVAAGDAPILAVPLGSCEQHGPHLPLDTDTVIATALARGLAAARDDVLVAPPIGIAASGEHSGFAGTLSIGTAVLESVIIELVRSADWARGVVLVNGHGGNAHPLRSAVRLLNAEGLRVLAWYPRAGGDAHAGRTETSLMLALGSARVRLERAEVGATDPLEVLMPRLRDEGVAAVSANGVLGDPAGASATEGRALLAELWGDLVAAVAAWDNQ